MIQRGDNIEILFLCVAFICLHLFYPIRIHIYSEDEIKSYVVLYGFIKIRTNIKEVIKNFTDRDKKAEEEDFSIMETLENYKKLLSTRPVLHDLTKRTVIERFHWYTSLPMDNPLLGLSILPIVASLQNLILSIINENYKRVEDVDIDTKYNDKTSDLFVYVDCIIKTNLSKIIIVGLKYLTKLPLIIKRMT